MRMRPLTLFILSWGFLGATLSASADGLWDRILARGYLSCGGVARPGLAAQDDQGKWTGLEIDLCRAIATAVFHSPDKVQFHPYATDKDFEDGVHSDDVSFLSGSEIADHGLAGKVLPGPTVFVESQAVMVAKTSKIAHLKDLQDKTVCFLIGSSAERALSAYADGLRRPILRRPFSEDGEMEDAYAVQNCQAIAGEVTDLADLRNDTNVRYLSSRILPETLIDFPILATTGTSDARWAALVAWTIDTVISADHRESRWYAGGPGAMPVVAPDLGLVDGWQAEVLRAVGTYQEIFRRNLGEDSELKLEPHPLWAPFRD